MKKGFSTYILDEVLKRKKNEMEKKRKEMFRRVKEAVRDLNFSEAYIFGSITKPYKWRDDSDIDIGFFGLSDEGWFNAFRKLSDRLERDVDILHLEGHRLKEKIVKEGILIVGDLKR